MNYVKLDNIRIVNYLFELFSVGTIPGVPYVYMIIRFFFTCYNNISS